MTAAEYYVRKSEIRSGIAGDVLGIAISIRAARKANVDIDHLAANAILAVADDLLAKIDALDREDRGGPYLVKGAGR